MSANTLTDHQKRIVVEIINSGTASTVRKLNKSQLNGAESRKICKLIDLLPETAQWAFNAIQGLPELERIELCALAVGVEKILHNLVEINQPYQLAHLIGKQVNNGSLFPGSSAGLPAKFCEILQADNMSSCTLTFQGAKRMVEL